MLRFLTYLVMFVVGAKIIKKLFATNEPDRNANSGNEDVKIQNSSNDKPITDGKGEYIDYEEIKD